MESSPEPSALFYISSGANNGLVTIERHLAETISNINNHIATKGMSKYAIYGAVNSRDFTVKAEARVGKQRGTGFILINAGVYFALADTCYTTALNPEFLAGVIDCPQDNIICLCPKCRNERSFHGWLRDYSWLKSQTSHTLPWHPMLCSLAPNPRSVIGDFLLNRALFWVSAHEAGHLLLDHHKMLNLPTIHEDAGEQESLHTDFRHYVEFEADLFASYLDTDIEGAMADLNARILSAKTNANPNTQWPDIDAHLAARLLLLVPVLVTLLFVARNNQETSKYPRPIFRMRSAQMSLVSLLREHRNIDLDAYSGELYHDREVAAMGCLPAHITKIDFMRKLHDADYASDAMPLFEKLPVYIAAFGTMKDRLTKYGLGGDI